jgi:hypothetical protein
MLGRFQARPSEKVRLAVGVLPHKLISKKIVEATKDEYVRFI